MTQSIINHQEKEAVQISKLSLILTQEWTFKMKVFFLKATEWEKIKTDVKYHDTIIIKVLKSDFDKKYIRRDSMSVFGKIANMPLDKFEFYSFKFRDKEYVSDLYEAANQHQQDNQFALSIMGFVFIGMGIFSFTTKK